MEKSTKNNLRENANFFRLLKDSGELFKWLSFFLWDEHFEKKFPFFFMWNWNCNEMIRSKVNFTRQLSAHSPNATCNYIRSVTLVKAYFTRWSPTFCARTSNASPSVGIPDAVWRKQQRALPYPLSSLNVAKTGPGRSRIREYSHLACQKFGLFASGSPF